MLHSASSPSPPSQTPGSSHSTDKVTTQLPHLSDSNSPTATNFHLFPNLIPELRIQIWRAYLSTPRLITISAHPSVNTSPASTSATSNSNKTIHIARHAPSALLSVNSESRYEALHHYTSLPNAEEVRRDRLPYHTQHKSSTKGFYRRPGDDVVYLKGCYYDSRWFRGVGVVGREVIAELSTLLELSLNSRESEYEEDPVRGKLPTLGRIRTLALDEAFLNDETLFGRPEVSPVMVYLMCDLKGLDTLIVVREEGLMTGVDEIESRIDEARRKLVWRCELWGYVEEVEELRGWKCPALELMSRKELGLLCGQYV